MSLQSSGSNNNSSGDDWEVVVHVSPTPACYLRDTLFQTEFEQYIKAKNLRVDSEVLGISGQKLRVMSKVEHGRAMRELVTLHTAQAVLSITADHRVAVKVEGSSFPKEAEAGQLRRDMHVFCGCRPQKLTKVVRWQSQVEAGCTESRRCL